MESVAIITNPPEEESVDVLMMYGFASVNLLIDIVCLVLFYYNLETALFHDPSIRVRVAVESGERDLDGVMSGEQDIEMTASTSFLEEVCGGSPPNESDGQLKKTNLNMLAAFYHVGADLLRTIAVYFGAAASTFGENLLLLW